jgi:hypothetical protein
MSAADWHRQVLARIGRLAQGPAERPEQAIDAVLDLALGHRLQRLTYYLWQACGGVVQAGPFAGMKYLRRSAGSLLAPKLLGCYEAELHPALARVARRQYEAVVNVGCGEGYYAVGLARLLPAARVYAFDGDAAAQNLCRELAALNGVAGRVAVAGTCGAAELRELAGPRVLVVCDCEGGEVTLLDPAQAPGLTVCDVVVELHDYLDPTASRQVPERFAPTHEVALIGPSGRNPAAFPLLRGLSQFEQFLAVLEGRPGPTPWAFLTPAPTRVERCHAGPRQAAAALPDPPVRQPGRRRTAHAGAGGGAVRPLRGGRRLPARGASPPAARRPRR